MKKIPKPAHNIWEDGGTESGMASYWQRCLICGLQTVVDSKGDTETHLRNAHGIVWIMDRQEPIGCFQKSRSV